MTPGRPPVMGFAAFSGTGKTTLLEAMLPLCRARGLRVGVLKHAHHAFDVDHPGKDSYRLRHAGAVQTLVASDQRWALMVEEPRPEAPDLDALLGRYATPLPDFVLVEGFRHARLPKIELHRPLLGHPLLAPGDPCIVAVATDAPEAIDSVLPLLDLNQPAAVLAFVLAHLGVDGAAAEDRQRP